MALTPTDISRIAAAVIAANKPKDKAMSLQEASEYMGMSVSWIKARLRNGDLPFFRLGLRRVRIMQSNIDSYIESQRLKSM